MRNDLKDDPIEIPSLTIDKDDPLEQGYFDTHHNKSGATAKVSYGLKKFWGYIFLLLFILYTAGMVGLFWLGKQAADSVQSQLDEKTTSTSLLTQTTAGQLQKVTEQLTSQQDLTKTTLESLRLQNKQLANKLVELSTMQQKILLKQQEVDKQLNGLQDKVVDLTSRVVTSDNSNRVNELSNEVNALKKSQVTGDNLKSLSADIEILKKQNLPQVISSIQDDLSSLRSQLGVGVGQYVGDLQGNTNRQLEEIQNKLQAMQRQLDSRSPY